MAKIYKRSDRIAVKIKDITVKLAPLSIDQKAEIQQAMLNGRVKSDIKELTRGMVLSVKYSLKSIEGVTDSNDKPYALEFEGENLTDSCVNDLFNLEVKQELALVCSSLVKNIPNDFTDENGQKLEGVELIKPSEKSESSEKN